MANSKEILFEKFEIIEVLKKDEHAGVYLANHIYLHKKIILKVLNTVRIQDKTQIDRFKREAKILAQLDHPNIIKVLDFGTSTEYFYISFEYIEGMSLRNLMSTRELNSEQKESLMIQLLRGMDYAHNNKIIHRDIKPENIFINEQMQVKIGDFGLALSADDNFVTQPFAIVGTPSYMSPEQVRGVKLTQQSDLFSVGVVLFELFIGRNPFLKENINLTINEVMSFTDDGIADQIKDLPEKINSVLTKLLKKNVAARYKTAAEALKDLNVSIEQITMSIPAPAAKKSRVKIFAPLIAVPVLAVLVYFAFLQNSKPEQNSALPETEKLIPAQNNNVSPAEQSKTAENKIDNKAEENKSQDKPVQTTESKTENQPETKPAAPPVFEPRFGELFVECQPWGKLYIDGQEYGDSPFKPIKLGTGLHSVKLVHPDYPVYFKDVNIEEGRMTNLRVILNNEVSFLDIKVFPWGNIYVDGEFKGQHPIPGVIRLLPGRHRITVKRTDFNDIDTTVNFTRKDTVRLKLSFEKK